MKAPSMRSLVQHQESSSLMMPDRAEIKKTLGTGPLRFCPPAGEASIEEQIDSLSISERLCFMKIQEKWLAKNPAASKSLQSLFLLFARCCPGGEAFNQEMALKVLKLFDKRYLNLTAMSMEDALLEKGVFPTPGVRTHEGTDVVYMRASRFEPKKEIVQAILDPIAYVLMSLSTTKESASTDGICFLMNMDGYKMSNFSADYMRHLLAILQGLKAPVRVSKVIMINVPCWFDTVWNMMTAMMTKDFTSRIVRIEKEDLGEHLSGDYEAFLPDDLSPGTVDTNQLVRDFLAYRKHVEKVKEIMPARPAMDRQRSQQRVTFDPAILLEEE